jgi:hypothetical protein
MRDWHRTEVVRSVMCLIEENLLEYASAQAIVDRYDERHDEKAALQLMLEYENKDEPVSIHEAMNEVMSGLVDAEVDRRLQDSN